MNPKVDFYFAGNNKWHKELVELRKIILSCGLAEELKWGSPCYMFNKTNIVLIHVFKEYCAILFFKGALMKDPDGILVQQTKNTQAARQIRFAGSSGIRKMKDILKAYIYEAIEVEKAGLKVRLKRTAEFTMPEELQARLKEDSAFKSAFHALTPGRQRAYILYFSQPKQSRTRESRIERSTQDILAGKGLNDDRMVK